MGLQEEVREQIGRCVAGIPWVLEVKTGKTTPDADNIATDELLHGTQILAIELARIAERLAGEIDALRAA